MVKFLKKNKQVLFFSLITFLVLALDQLTKYLMEIFRPEFKLEFLTIQYIQNTGAGFGILKSYTWTLTLISFLAALTVILMYKEIPKDKVPQILFAVFLGGVLGNFLDRLLKSYVVDFINPGFWPAFNIADTAISIAVIGLVIYFFVKRND